MKLKIHFFILIMAFGLSLTGLVQANTGADRETYDWQAARYPNTQESFKEDVDKQARPRPEFSSQEKVYQWQLDEYENTEESFKEDINKQLRPRPEFKTDEQMYNWQLEEYPHTQEVEPTLPERY